MGQGRGAAQIWEVKVCRSCSLLQDLLTLEGPLLSGVPIFSALQEVGVFPFLGLVTKPRWLKRS